MARCFAAAINQAPGLRGIPASGHCCRAETRASWARSSATSMSRTTRVRAAISLGDSMRQTASIAPWVSDTDTHDAQCKMQNAKGKMRNANTNCNLPALYAQLPHGAHLDAADPRRWNARGDLHRLVHVIRVNQVEAGELFLGLSEG